MTDERETTDAFLERLGLDGPGVTAGQWIDTVEADPAWQAEQAEWQAVVDRKRALDRPEFDAVEADLRAAGFAFNTISHLSNTQKRTPEYRDAVPILMHWLPRVTRPGVKRTVAAGLATTRARPVAALPLIAEYRAWTDPDDARDAMAFALRFTATRDHYADLAELAANSAYRGRRAFLLPTIGRLAGPGARELLLELLDDPELDRFALEGLRYLRDPATRDAIVPYLAKNPNEQVPREARRALKAIDTKPRRR